MRLLISSPCMGGQLTERYTSSLISCLGGALAEGLLTGWEIHFQGKESLIHRARDRAANYFLTKNFDKLLTIDADIEFSYENFKRIITSDESIVGGTYPLKAFPVTLNFIPLEGKGSELYTKGIDHDSFVKIKKTHADERGLLEVAKLPTGFLCVKREVFEKLKAKVSTYGSYDPVQGAVEYAWHFYPSGVHGHILESEDWSFCRLARESGFKIYLDTKVVCGHSGNHVYRLGQFYGEVNG